MVAPAGVVMGVAVVGGAKVVAGAAVVTAYQQISSQSACSPVHCRHKHYQCIYEPASCSLGCIQTRLLATMALALSGCWSPADCFTPKQLSLVIVTDGLYAN